MRFQKSVEQFTENILWSVRFLAIVPVLFGLLSTVTLFFLGSLEILEGIQLYWHSEHGETQVITKIMTGIVGGIDLYLIGIVLMLFSFGIYELFISKIDVGRNNQEIRILEIHSLDQLKDKILKVIVMVLVVRIFKVVSGMTVQTFQDVLFLAIAIILIAGSSYLMHQSSHVNHNNHSGSNK
ncbi:MAG TPA: YqhA family protein [Leptolyngbyaceae cyanobacterium]